VRRSRQGDGGLHDQARPRRRATHPHHLDDEPERGEHYHLSGSYPARTPAPDEMMAALTVLIPGGGQFGALTPARMLIFDIR